MKSIHINIFVFIFIIIIPVSVFAKWIPLQSNNQRFTPAKDNKPPAPTVNVEFSSGYSNQNSQKLAPAKNNDIINVSLSLSGFWLTDIELDSSNYQSLTTPGMSNRNEPGKPALPMKRIFIEIPDKTSFSYEIVDRQTVSFDSIYTMPSQYPDRNSLNDSIKKEFVIDSSIYGGNAYYPENIIFNSNIILMRDHRVLAIDIAPFQFNPVEKKVIVTNSISIKLNLKANDNQEIENGLASSVFDKSMSLGIYGFNRFK